MQCKYYIVNILYILKSCLLNIFDPGLVKSADIEHVDTRDQLYLSTGVRTIWDSETELQEVEQPSSKVIAKITS